MSGWRDIQRGVAGTRDRLIGQLKRPGQRQSEVLQGILQRNRDTEFGIRYGFRKIRTVADFQRRVPLHTYDELRHDIDRMMSGVPDVLCGEQVLLYEETGGSSGGQKFLPYTKSSLEAIRCAVFPWLDDLILTRPKILSGRAYWSISPAARKRNRTAAGVPIGMPGDAAYFGEELGRAIEQTLAVPASVLRSDSIVEWRRRTVACLLSCHDLSFVSVWSPTFLLQLLDAISCDANRAASDVERTDSKRAAEIREWSLDEPVDWQRLWPGLDTISCWSSAASKPYADELRSRFPGVHLQGKGLLATEGVISLPLDDACAPVPAVGSAFFEFIDDLGAIVTLEELESGASYSVVLTTSGGLYRYRIGDRIRVVGRFQQSPCLEYTGRDNAQSDLCGEKLHEEFVQGALASVPGPSMLVPITGVRPSYLLLLDAGAVPAEAQTRIADSVDRALRLNPQYQYARELGQLAPLQAKRLADPVGLYHEVCLAAGRRLGDIKPVSLASPWWADAFREAEDR